MAGQFPSMGGGSISQNSGFMMPQQQQGITVSAAGFGGSAAAQAGFQASGELGSFSGSGGGSGGFSSFPISTMASFPSQQQQTSGGYPAPPAYSQSPSASFSPAAVSYNGLPGAAAYGGQSPVYAHSPAAGRPQLAASPAAGFSAAPGSYQHIQQQQPSRFQQAPFQQQQQQQPAVSYSGPMQGFAGSQQQQQQFGPQQLPAQYNQLQQPQTSLPYQQQQQQPGSAAAQMFSTAGASGMNQLAGTPTPPQQQQQQQQQPAAVQQQPATQQQQPQQHRDYNVATLCRYGQEYLLDLVNRSQELFNLLKQHQPPNGTAQGANISADKQTKIKQQLDCIRMLFRRLRFFHDRIAESCAGLEFTPIESLIPYKDEPDTKLEEKKGSELYRKALEEYNEVKEQVQQRSRYVKEVIDQLRNIVWDVNTMLAMRCTN